MRANPADYDLISPGSLSAVLALLAEQPSTWTPIAGGTELMVQFAAGRLAARRLVNINGLPDLMQVTVAADEIIIGAGVNYTTIRNHVEISRDLPLLARAASWTGAIANQNRGTLGGNLVNGSPAADSPPALLAYAAEVSLVSVRGTRRIPYADFHTAYKVTALAPDELVLAVHVPRTTYTHQYIRKVGPRNAQAISKVALAAVANITDGIVTEVRIGLASVSHSPFRCRNTEAALLDQAVSAATIAEARAALLAEIAPLDDIRSTARYRNHVSANLLEEFLNELLLKTEPDRLTEAQLLDFCASHRWAREVSALALFPDHEALFAAAESVWFNLCSEADWLEAFAAHPRIGEKKASTNAYLASSETEQSAAQQTLEPVAEALLKGNRAYEEKFGFRYIVFASGRTAPELLAVLEERLSHTRKEELLEAAHQQHRITSLRMTKWLEAQTKA